MSGAAKRTSRKLLRPLRDISKTSWDLEIPHNAWNGVSANLSRGCQLACSVSGTELTKNFLVASKRHGRVYM